MTFVAMPFRVVPVVTIAGFPWRDQDFPGFVIHPHDSIADADHLRPQSHAT
jgi:hypothetical protein